jgi:nondiscriminating glutamyl-tRNA synthetase
MSKKTNKEIALPGQEIRVRMAPSPTGLLHIGTVRTALFNYLFAKKYGGTFVLRVEDTDIERSKDEYEKDILDGLRWLGINWDEGVDEGGEYGPYRQKERTHIYAKYIEKLLEEKHAYHCFCTEEEIEAEYNDMKLRGVAPKYSGKCRDIPDKDTQAFKAEGRRSVIRFAVPEKKVKFHDLIHGDIEFDASLMGDIVIAKGIALPLYNFAVVVDDYEMKISHVMRGEDHISNTPKQILMQEALGFPSPQYAHIPLILGPDKTKLSKRNATVSIDDYKGQGYLPEALVNFIAFLGWNPGDDREVFSLKELEENFDINKIQKAGAIFNIKKLEWLNGSYIRNLSAEELFQKALPFALKEGLLKEKGGSEFEGRDGEVFDAEFVKRAFAVEKDRLKRLGELPGLCEFYFKKQLDYPPSILGWKNMPASQVLDSLKQAAAMVEGLSEKELDKEQLKEALMQKAKAFSAESAGHFMWPLRVALSGKEASPAPFEIIPVIGKERALERIKFAITQAEKL